MKERDDFCPHCQCVSCKLKREMEAFWLKEKAAERERWERGLSGISFGLVKKAKEDAK